MVLVGIAFVFFGSLFGEIGSSIGKYETQHKQESIFTLGFLQFFWGSIFLLVIGLFIRNSFVFTLQLIPLSIFAIRAVLDSILVFYNLRGTRDAERSTFGFLKTITIPLLLVIDITIGYAISPKQIVGITLIAAALLLLFINHGIKKKGAKDVLIASLLAVATISLYKYNITHYNSVEAEQGIMLAYLSLYMFILARYLRKENPITFLKRPIFQLQSLTSGLATMGYSFAYAFAPASIIVTAQRSLTILFSIVAGEVYFNEKNILLKLASFVLVVIGIVLLI